MLRRLQVFGDDTGTIGFEKHAKPVIDLVLDRLGLDDVNGHHLVSEEIISTMGELIRRIAGNGIVLSDQKVEAKILDITEKEMKNFQAERGPTLEEESPTKEKTAAKTEYFELSPGVPPAEDRTAQLDAQLLRAGGAAESRVRPARNEQGEPAISLECEQMPHSLSSVAARQLAPEGECERESVLSASPLCKLADRRTVGGGSVSDKRAPMFKYATERVRCRRALSVSTYDLPSDIARAW